MKRAVLLCILMYILLSSLFAVPYTTIGQLRVPDAYVLPHKSAELSFTNYLRREKSDFDDLPPYEYIPMGMVNIGLFDRIGVGAWAGDNIGFVNVKVKIIEETQSIPQVSVGVDNLFSPVREDANKIKPGEDYYDNPDRTFYEKNSPYLVFSKASVIRGMSGLPLLETFFSLGVGRNRFKGQVSIAKRFEGIFGSVTIKPAKNMSLTFENDGANINLGVQYSYQKFSFKISYVGLEEQENNRIGLGISYLFDKYADSRRKIYDPNSNTSLKESELLKSQLTGKDANVNSDLLDELKKLRDQREQAQKVLDDLKNQLQDMEEETGTD